MRHIERNAVLLFMVAATADNIEREYKILLGELEKYNPQLLTKARLLAITKCDTQTDAELAKLQKKQATLSKKLDIPVVLISSISGMGIPELKDMLWTELQKEQNQVIEISHAPIHVEQHESNEVAADDTDEPETIYLSEQDEEWDLEKYRGIGWDQ